MRPGGMAGRAGPHLRPTPGRRARPLGVRCERQDRRAADGVGGRVGITFLPGKRYVGYHTGAHWRDLEADAARPARARRGRPLPLSRTASSSGAGCRTSGASWRPTGCTCCASPFATRARRATAGGSETTVAAVVRPCATASRSPSPAVAVRPVGMAAACLCARPAWEPTRRSTGSSGLAPGPHASGSPGVRAWRASGPRGLRPTRQEADREGDGCTAELKPAGRRSSASSGPGPAEIADSTRIELDRPRSDAPGDDRLLRSRRRGRHRRWMPSGIGSFGPLELRRRTPSVRPHHDDPEARLVGYRRRRPIRRGARRPDRLRHRRQRRRPRRGPVGRRARPPIVRLPHPGHGDRRRGRRRGDACCTAFVTPRWATSPCRVAGRPLRRRLPVPRRLPGGAGQRAGRRSSLRSPSRAARGC